MQFSNAKSCLRNGDFFCQSVTRWRKCTQKTEGSCPLVLLSFLSQRGGKRAVLLVWPGGVQRDCSGMMSGCLQAEDLRGCFPGVTATCCLWCNADGKPVLLRNHSRLQTPQSVEAIGFPGTGRWCQKDLVPDFVLGIEESQEHAVRYLSCGKCFLSPDFLIWSLFRCCGVVVQVHAVGVNLLRLETSCCLFPGI